MRGFTACLTLGMVALLTIGTALSLPLFLGPDEPQHLQYAAWITQNGLPDPGATTVLQAQHPPLYHAFLGAAYETCKALDGPVAGKADTRELALPFYERRVALAPEEPILDPIAWSVAEAEGDEARRKFAEQQPRLKQRTPYLLRLTGLVFALITAATILFVTPRVIPKRRNLAALAAALAVLTPQFSAIFATPNNDQFAILFSTLGFGVVALAAARGRVDSPRLLIVAGILFGLGFLSKAFVLGAFVAAAILILVVTRGPSSRKLRSLLLLLAGPLLLSAWWFVWQVYVTGTPHALAATFRHNPEMLRPAAPDALGLIEIVGKLVQSYLSDVGRDHLTPGILWMSAAALIPFTVVAAAFAGLRARDSQPIGRALCAAFMVGLLVQLAVILYGNIHFAHVQGRYLFGLALPGALALSAGLPRLLGRRAGPALGLMVVLAAAGGILLLHGRVLPIYHAGHRIQTVPWTSSYVDLGCLKPDPRIEPAEIGRESDWYYSRPVARWCCSRDPNRPLKVTFDDLDAQGLYLLSVRRHPWERFVGKGRVSAFDLLADGAQVSGPLSHGSQRVWPTFPVPRSATLDGSFLALIRPQAAIGGGLSEMLLRKLPLKFSKRAVEGDTLHVTFQEDEPGITPQLSVQLGVGGAPSGPIVELSRGGTGAREARLPLPPAGAGPLLLLLRLPEGVYADTLVAPFRNRDRERISGAVGSPGIFVLEVEPGQDLQKEILSIPGIVFAPNDYRFVLLDRTGADVSESFRVDADGLGADARRQDGAYRIPRQLDVASRLRFTFEGKSAVSLARMEARASLYYVFDLRITR